MMAIHIGPIYEVARFGSHEDVKVTVVHKPTLAFKQKHVYIIRKPVLSL
jgi:hypothetical protein